jgi:adenine-specific DNA glycosylase
VKDGRLDRYPAHRRELPLRRTIDAYASRVAEVTLEQTQVARVVPRYEGGLRER